MTRFAPIGPLALHPSAFGREFSAQEISPPKFGPSACVIPIQGPLTHHFEITEPDKPWGLPRCFDNYDAIRARTELALQGESKAVVLAIDSPGGHAIGMFDLVSEIRAMAKAAGKSLYTWVDGNCTSAAYAIACAGERIYAGPGTIVGSIGVIDPLIDQTVHDKAMGIKWTMLTTGTRKADGNPHAGLSRDALIARQSVINSIGQTFFQLVAERRGLKASQVQGLNAATYTAEQAIKVGLVDEITTLDSLLAKIRNNTITSQGTRPMNYKEAVAELRKVAEGDDEDAKKAKKALNALDNPSPKKTTMEEAIALLRKAADGEDEDAQNAKKMLKSAEGHLYDYYYDKDKKKDEKEPTKGTWSLPSPGQYANQSSELKAQMDTVMDLTRLEPGVKNEAHRVVLGFVPKQC